MDDFFTALGNSKPYFKAAFEGFAGSGKTYTAATVAIGLHKRIQSKLPIVIFDTERASKFLKPLFAENGIEAIVRESRSLADLKETMKRMRAGGVSDILLIDSISHIWEDALESFKKRPIQYGKPAKTRLEFADWGIIKPTWKVEFSEPFVNDPYHAIFTGRAGYEYQNEINEETKKREIYKSGIKMKVEGETAYEPDMLVLMERFEEVLDDKKKVWREATVLKDRNTDRATNLDGKTFRDPSYADFSPCIEAMLTNPIAKNPNVMVEGDTGLLFPTEEGKQQWIGEKIKARENLEGLMTRIAPGNTGKDKQLKLDLLEKVLGTTSETEIGEMSPQRLRDAYTAIGNEAVARGIAVVIQIDGQPRLVSKEHLQKEMGTTEDTPPVEATKGKKTAKKEATPSAQ